MSGTNDSAPVDYAARWDRHQAARHEAYIQNRRIVFDALSRSGLASITVSFNGEGDSGQIEDISVSPEEHAAPLDIPAKMMTVPWPGLSVLDVISPKRLAEISPV